MLIFWANNSVACWDLCFGAGLIWHTRTRAHAHIRTHTHTHTRMLDMLGAWGKHRWCYENVWIVGDEHVVVEVVVAASVFIVPRCCREIKYRQTFEKQLWVSLHHNNNSNEEKKREKQEEIFVRQNKNEFSCYDCCYVLLFLCVEYNCCCYSPLCAFVI